MYFPKQNDRDCQCTFEENPKFTTWKTQLGWMTMEFGRCGGRLKNADILFSTKHPVLLTKQHTFTTLLVQAAHRRVQHNGVRETLGEVRVKYWIINVKAITVDVTKEGLSSPLPLLLFPFSELMRPHRSPIQLLIMLDLCTLGNRRFGFVCSLHGQFISRLYVICQPLYSSTLFEH